MPCVFNVYSSLHLQTSACMKTNFNLFFQKLHLKNWKQNGCSKSSTTQLWSVYEQTADAHPARSLSSALSDNGPPLVSGRILSQLHPLFTWPHQGFNLGSSTDMREWPGDLGRFSTQPLPLFCLTVLEELITQWFGHQQ